MLVLTRKLGQIVSIGDPTADTPPIEITITEIQRGTNGGDQVRIGITAPSSVPIWRKELVNSPSQPSPAPRL